MACMRTLIFLIVVMGTAQAQMCTPGSAILKLVQLDTCRDAQALVECTGKMQLAISQYCTAQLQPEMKVASDGTYCEPTRGVQSRNTVSGKFNMGRSDLDMELRNAGSGMILMLLKGRIVPDAGGRETSVDCNLIFNVTAGNALGVVSQGTDSLMGTTYTGPPLPAGAAYGGYSGVNGLGLPGQQQTLPGQLTANSAYSGQGLNGQQQQQQPAAQGQVSWAGSRGALRGCWLLLSSLLALLLACVKA